MFQPPPSALHQYPYGVPRNDTKANFHVEGQEQRRTQQAGAHYLAAVDRVGVPMNIVGGVLSALPGGAGPPWTNGLGGWGP